MHNIKYLLGVLQVLLIFNILGIQNEKIIVFRAYDTQYNIDYSNILLEAIREGNDSLIKDTISLMP